MSKTKVRDHGKRRQKASMKAKARAGKRGPTPPSVGGPHRRKFTDDMFPDADYLFWVAHGVNYIVSDYANGVWAPIFDGIYTGQTLDAEQIVQGVTTRFGENTEHTPQENAVLAWTVQPKSIVYVYYQEALRRLRGDDPTCDAPSLIRQPHQGVVWGVFEHLKNELVRRRAGSV